MELCRKVCAGVCGVSGMCGAMFEGVRGVDFRGLAIDRILI